VVMPAMRPAMIHGFSRQELLPQMIVAVETITEKKRMFPNLDVAEELHLTAAGD